MWGISPLIKAYSYVYIYHHVGYIKYNKISNNKASKSDYIKRYAHKIFDIATAHDHISGMMKNIGYYSLYVHLFFVIKAICVGVPIMRK